jgi:hypothetical protein
VPNGPAATGDYRLPPGWQPVDTAVATIGNALTPAVAMPGSGRVVTGGYPTQVMVRTDRRRRGLFTQ